MKKPTVILFVLLNICTVATISFAHKADSLMLRLHLKQGDKYVLSCLAKGENSSEINSKPDLFKQRSAIDILVTVSEVKANGLVTLSLKIINTLLDMSSKEMSLHMETKDSTKTYGSTQAAENVAIDAYSTARKLIGTIFWVECNERAEVLRTNIDTVIDRKSDINQIISGNAKMALQMASFPDYPVKIGDKWKGIGAENKEGKVLSAVSNFTLKSIDKNIASISSESHGWGDVTDANLLTTYTGEEKVDTISGLTMWGHYNMIMEAKQKEQYLKIKQDITITLAKR
jgi:hypothetical protein